MSQIETIYIKDVLNDMIKVRYADISARSFGSSNMVVDAYYPTAVRASIRGESYTNYRLGKKCSAISPFIANEFGVNQMPIDDIVRILGYKKQDIKNILSAVKDKKLRIALVGFGGTGVNFTHWTEELCNYANTINIFKEILIYENEVVELHNMFRFPINIQSLYMHEQITTNTPIYKTKLLKQPNVIAESITINNHYLSSSALHVKTYKTNENGAIEKDSKGVPLQTFAPNKRLMNDYIFYGAPDIETRELLAQDDWKFISATHGDNDCQLYIKPEQDSSLQVESYGMINLSVFFMNHVKMTISFLELLASNTDLTKSAQVMEYSFAKEYSNGRTIKTGLSRTYNFPIQTESFVDQELNMPEPAEDPTVAESGPIYSEPQGEEVQEQQITWDDIAAAEATPVNETMIPQPTPPPF